MYIMIRYERTPSYIFLFDFRVYLESTLNNNQFVDQARRVVQMRAQSTRGVQNGSPEHVFLQPNLGLGVVAW